MSKMEIGGSRSPSSPKSYRATSPLSKLTTAHGVKDDDIEGDDERRYMTYHSTASPPGTAMLAGADFTTKYSSGDVSYRHETWGHGSLSFSRDALRAIKTPPATALSVGEKTAAATTAAATMDFDNMDNTSRYMSSPRWMKMRPVQHLKDLLDGSSGGQIEGSSDRRANRLDFKLPASFIPETSWLLETLPIPTQSSVPLRPSLKSRSKSRGDTNTTRPSMSTSKSTVSWSSDVIGESTTSIIAGRDTKFIKRGELYHESTRRLRSGESIQFARPLWPSRSPSSRQETVLLRRWFRENQASLQLSPAATRALLDPAMQSVAGSARAAAAADCGRRNFERIAFHRDEDGTVVREETEEGEKQTATDATETAAALSMPDMLRDDYHTALEKTCSLRELYAVAFHELSRQVSAHCSERGTFMNELWVNYTACLDEQLDILKNQRNTAMEREAMLMQRVEAFEAERSSYKESVHTDVHRKDTEISILRTQLEDERRAREKLEKDRNKKRRSSSTEEDSIVERDVGRSYYYGSSSYDDDDRRGSVTSTVGVEDRRRRRSSLYQLPQTSSVHNHEIETLTNELESAGLRASEYREELEKVQTSYEKMEVGILQLESQLAAAENRAELAESDLTLLQAECERLRDEARRLTPRPERCLHEDFDALTAEQRARVREVIETTALSRDGVSIAAKILLGGVARDYNLDDKTFAAFWAVIVTDKTKQTTRRNRRSFSLVQVKDLLEQTHDSEDELAGRYGTKLAAMIRSVIAGGTASSDDVVACMMGLVPGLGESGALLSKECFGCLRDTFSEEQAITCLEASMQSTRERMERDAATLTRLSDELAKMVAWKEQTDRENADKQAKRARYEEIKDRRTESSPMDIFLETEWQETFIGLGTGPNVPRYMRTNSKIRNRNMSKRETEKTVKEIWAEKNAVDKKENSVSELSVFTSNFFQKKVGLPAAVTEMMYNFMYSLKKYDYDADCELFLKIILGQIKEEVYHEQIRLCVAVEDVFKQIDLACNGDTEARGVLQKDDAKQALRSFFADKIPERLEELLAALDETCPSTSVEYTLLFAEDREFNQGPFAECIRDQFLEERLEQIENLEKAIYECADYEEMCTAEHVETASVQIFGKALSKQAILAAMQGRELASIGSVMDILRRGVIVKTENEDGKGVQGVRKAVQIVRATGKFKGGRNRHGSTTRRVSVAVDSVRQEWMKKESVGKQPLTTNRKMTHFGKPIMIAGEHSLSPSKSGPSSPYKSVGGGGGGGGDLDDVAERLPDTKMVAETEIEDDEAETAEEEASTALPEVEEGDEEAECAEDDDGAEKNDGDEIEAADLDMEEKEKKEKEGEEEGEEKEEERGDEGTSAATATTVAETAAAAAAVEDDDTAAPEGETYDTVAEPAVVMTADSEDGGDVDTEVHMGHDARTAAAASDIEAGDAGNDDATSNADGENTTVV